MTYNEFQALLVTHLRDSITKASHAGEQAQSEKEQGIYHGVILQARQTLQLVHSAYVGDNRILIDPGEFDTLIRCVDDDNLRRKLQILKG